MANQSLEKKKEQEANETDTDADKAVKLKREDIQYRLRRKPLVLLSVWHDRFQPGVLILVPPDKLAA